MLVVMLVMMGGAVRLLQLTKLVLHRVAVLHCGKDLLSVQLIPRRCDNGRTFVMLTQKRKASLKLLLGEPLRVAEDDRGGTLHLVAEEFTEILHIHLAFLGINDRCEAVQNGILRLCIAHGADHVTQLPYAGGLYQHAIGTETFQHLKEGAAEIRHKAATDTARIHFIDLNTGIAQKAAVDTDLTKFVFNQNHLLAGICLLEKLFDQRGLSGSEKSGKDIYFRHGLSSFFFEYLQNEYSTNPCQSQGSSAFSPQERILLYLPRIMFRNQTLLFRPSEQARLKTTCRFCRQSPRSWPFFPFPAKGAYWTGR